MHKDFKAGPWKKQIRFSNSLRWKNCPSLPRGFHRIFTSKPLNFREAWLCSLCQPLWLGNPRPLTPSWKVAVDQVWRAIDTDNQSFVAFSLPLPDTIFTSHAERNKIISSLDEKFNFQKRRDIRYPFGHHDIESIQFPLKSLYISKKRKKKRTNKYQRFEKFRIILDGKKGGDSYRAPIFPVIFKLIIARFHGITGDGSGYLEWRIDLASGAAHTAHSVARKSTSFRRPVH